MSLASAVRAVFLGRRVDNGLRPAVKMGASICFQQCTRTGEFSCSTPTGQFGRLRFHQTVDG
jgi:hypothetical protein